MKRNTFGEPLPGCASELIAALDEIGLTGPDAQAELFHNPDEAAPFTGWSAEISDAETGEKRISTLGFATREALDDTLAAAGITLISEEWL